MGSFLIRRQRVLQRDGNGPVAHLERPQKLRQLLHVQHLEAGLLHRLQQHPGALQPQHLQGPEARLDSAQKGQGQDAEQIEVLRVVHQPEQHLDLLSEEDEVYSEVANL